MDGAAIRLTEEKWRAIADNDASYDGRFYYALTTTGIFCRPGCRSRTPNKANVRLFDRAEEALAEGFRPCKRCKPADARLPDEEWSGRIAALIDRHFGETLTLRTLAERCHGSPYHLQRTFKRTMGMTPAEYVQRTRMARARTLLAGTDKPVADIAAEVGLSSVSYFISLFRQSTGLTPAQYRQSGKANDEEELPHADDNGTSG